MYSDFQNYLSDAIDAVLSVDTPEEYFSGAVAAQAGLLAGMNPDDY